MIAASKPCFSRSLPVSLAPIYFFASPIKGLERLIKEAIIEEFAIEPSSGQDCHSPHGKLIVIGPRSTFTGEANTLHFYMERGTFQAWRNHRHLLALLLQSSGNYDHLSRMIKAPRICSRATLCTVVMTQV